MVVKQNAEGAVLAYIARTGSTWVKLEDLKRMMQILNIPAEGTDDLIREGRIVCSQNPAGTFLTLPRYAEMESRIARNMYRVLASAPTRKIPGTTKLREILKNMNWALADEQAEAVLKSAMSQLLVITGGPGTGKTYTLKAIDTFLRLLGYHSIIYTAPTGKAARRISESTGRPATTLHKQIGITKEKKTPKMLDCEVVIVDEVSMMDAEVADAFFQAVQSGTKVILVGDTNQLPSVGAGAILRDMIESDVIETARLIKTFRQGAESLIIANMKNIRDGIPDLKGGDDFRIAVPSEQMPAAETILEIYRQEYERLGGNEDIVVLTPFRQKKYATSSEALNERLQAMVNGSAKGFHTNRGIWFRIGDPVMQTENREECANGDVGRVTEVTKEGITVKYVDCEVKYAAQELDTSELALAYAMSIHKSQGSEYKTVITTLLNEHGPMLQRNLLYTAVTRAKEKCFLVVEPEAVQKAVKTQGDTGRTTQLAMMLQAYALKYGMQAS